MSSRYSLRDRSAQPAAAAPGARRGMATAAPSAPHASLQDVPEELLTRILSLACAGDDGISAEVLFRLGGLCAALRRACGSVEEAAAPMADTWSRAVIALVDPAAALLAAVSAQSGGLRSAWWCYLAHARSLGGWYPLVHALANRECVECEDVTRQLAWRIEGAEGSEPLGLCRCCADCTPPGAAGDASDDDASDSSEGHGILRCAVLNQQFWTEPTLVLNAAEWEHPTTKLLDCLRAADDGDTIGLRGDFRGIHFNTALQKSVRLLGVPDVAPYRWVHEAGPDDEPGQRMAQLRRFELESAAALGFPSASIHVERNCFEAYDAVWLENVYVSSGPRHLGTELPGEHEYNTVDELKVVTPSGRRATAFSGLGVFHIDKALPAPSAVLRRCWLSGYFGSGLVLSENCCAALLHCVITNSRNLHAHVPDGASLRMRGCRVLYNPGAVHFPHDQPDDVAAQHEPLLALAAANDFFRFAPPRRRGAAATVERVGMYAAGFDVETVRLLT